MSAPQQHNAPDSPLSDNDSDLDIDLHELDPQAGEHLSGATSHSTPHSHSRSPSYNLGDFARRIPLRNLRRRERERVREEEDGEDLEGLLEDEGRAGGKGDRDSGNSWDSAGDGAPLLPTSLSNGNGSAYPHNRARRKEPEEEDTRSSVVSRLAAALHIPGFSRPLQLSSEDDEDDADKDPHDPTTNRTIHVGSPSSSSSPRTGKNHRFPPNAISNAKYTPLSFLPRTLWNEFKFFLNLYFLLVALSQIIPALRIGYLSTYVAPLAFVLCVTLGKEAMDDIARRRRDAEANGEVFTVLAFGGVGGKERRRKSRRKGGEERGEAVREMVKPSRELKVGDVLKLGKNQRVPADVVILQSHSTDSVVATNASVVPETSASRNEQLIDAEGEDATQKSQVEATQDAAGSSSNTGGEAFIRTDQLDGETDWKLRLPSPLSQSLPLKSLTNLRITAAKPDRKVNEFVGMMEYTSSTTPAAYDTEGGEEGGEEVKRAALSIDNTAWANTVLASSTTVYAAIIYTGPQTRAALSTSASRSKTGLLELELNTLTKILCFLTLSLSGILVLIGRIEGLESREWYISVMRFLILFSTVVPISLRVNLDMGKSVYAWFIEHDSSIPGTVVRTSTIPEDLGRIEYLLSDKTGTLTQNEMELRKVHVGTVSYANEAMDEVATYVHQAFSSPSSSSSSTSSENAGVEELVTPSTPFTIPSTSTTRTRREIGSRVRDLVMALALCHNVTPTVDEDSAGNILTSYQASSPDEIAIVRWTEMVGLRLLHRDRGGMLLASTKTGSVVVRVSILRIFPFTSESKRMGIILAFQHSSTSSSSPRQGNEQGEKEEEEEIWFYQKGADTVMSTIVSPSDWLDEETANMAREGLRTLVIGRRPLTPAQYTQFASEYHNASLSLSSRDAAMASVVGIHLERNLELLGVTGVEDKLQENVKPSLELLRNAGIKIWMLTGDKTETARCVAISSKLVSRGQYIHVIERVRRREAAYTALEALRGKADACLLIDGESLATMLAQLKNEFIQLAVHLPAVVACRCSPTQKADITRLIRSYTGKRTLSIGDGGNDVSMIQAADVGVGIVGKEGRQASLAADFSIQRFCDLTKLLVWHGRNSYKRSAKLAFFVMQRGLVISVCQSVFSVAAGFEPMALYRVSYAPISSSSPLPSSPKSVLT